MIRKMMIGLAAASMAITAAPVMAQDEAEEARTTYRIQYVKLKPGSDQRWNELGEKYFGPASDAAGLKRPTIHWLMSGPWDLMLIFEMPRGMAMLDAHNSPERKAFREAMIKIAGSEEAAEKIFDESDALAANEVTTYSHTHP